MPTVPTASRVNQLDHFESSIRSFICHQNKGNSQESGAQRAYVAGPRTFHQAAHYKDDQYQVFQPWPLYHVNRNGHSHFSVNYETQALQIFDELLLSPKMHASGKAAKICSMHLLAHGWLVGWLGA